MEKERDKHDMLEGDRGESDGGREGKREMKGEKYM